jgi:hypothetical protein
MFMGLHDQNLFLRLAEHDRATFLQLEEANQFEPTLGRTMKEYVVIPPWMLDNTEVLNEWVKKSLTYVSSLPPKAQKEKRKKTDYCHF